MKFSNITTELLLRFKSNVVVTQDKNYGEIYGKDKDHTEIHFLRVEGQIKELSVDLKQIRKEGWKKFINEFGRGSNNKGFESWTITDFDGFLKGNPHCD